MTCQTCHGTGELVAVGNGRTIRLDEWNGDEGDLVDCPECKGEPMTIKDAEPQGAVDPKPYTSGELIVMAVEGTDRDPLRALATYADPSNWINVDKNQRNYWSWTGPVIVGYELGQSTIKQLTTRLAAHDQSDLPKTPPPSEPSIMKRGVI